METVDSRHKIVIADDSPLYRKLLQGTLAHENYCTLVAKDAREALALVSEHRPAILITDWEMPDVTGVELCSLVRQENGSNTYLILLTSNAEKEHIVAGLNAGADDYLTKPFHAGELLARVRVGIRFAELDREIRAKNRLLEELALTDALTGLSNRRALEHWAGRAFAAAQRHRYPLWMVIADLDHFKAVNDTYGHEAGDFVLRNFSTILKSHIRGSDICARLGGEEFVLGLSHIDRKGVETAVGRIREAITKECFVWNESTIRLTASFGIAGLSNEIRSFEQLLAQADSALYHAKNNGRDCIEFAQP